LLECCKSRATNIFHGELPTPKPLLQQLPEAKPHAHTEGLLATAPAAMDLVLEGFDTFLFDLLYATVLPARTPGLALNGTYSSLREAPTAAPYAAPKTWHYEAASEYLSFPPSKYAYMSEWPRDDWRRQLVTLFLITWYVLAMALFCFGRI
jgi:hypothetical protein